MARSALIAAGIVSARVGLMPAAVLLPAFSSAIVPTSKTADDDTPVRVPYSFLKPQPRVHAPEWGAFRPLAGTPITGWIQDARSGLATVRTALVTGVRVLDQVKTIVDMLAALEGIITGGLMQFLKILIDSLQQMSDDARSTGIYYLDLTSYHWRSESREAGLNKLEGAWYDDGISAADPGSRTGLTRSHMSGGNVTVAGGTEATALDTTSAMVEDFFGQSTGMTYARESYRQFVEVICSALSDANDVAATTGWVGGGDKEAKATYDRLAIQGSRNKGISRF